MKEKDNDFFGGDIFGDDDFSFGDEDKRPIAEQQKVELSDVLKKFKAQAKEEQKIFLENVDSEYWIAICFQSREQKEEFLRLAGWLKYGDKYLDGLEIAEKMKIKIKHLTPKLRKVRIDKDWAEFI